MQRVQSQDASKESQASNALAHPCLVQPSFGEPLVHLRAWSSVTRSETSELLLKTQFKHLNCFTACNKARHKHLRTPETVQVAHLKRLASHHGFKCRSASPTLNCPLCLYWIKIQLFQLTTVSIPMLKSSAIACRVSTDAQSFG